MVLVSAGGVLVVHRRRDGGSRATDDLNRSKYGITDRQLANWHLKPRQSDYHGLPVVNFFACLQEPRIYHPYCNLTVASLLGFIIPT